MALMTWPLTSDGAGAVTYTANEWRTLLTNLFTEGILGASSFEVTERAAGANMTLDIAAGVAILTGDDSAGQGHYIVRDDAAATSAVTITTANPTNPRIDRVGIQLRDPSEGGASGRDSFFDKVTGTAAASPSAPAEPDSFLTLALVTVPAGATSIVDANITDARTRATLVHDVLGDDSVSTDDIEDDAVTQAKIGPAAVGPTELDSAVPLGVVGYAQRTTSQNVTGTSETAITSMTVTFTAVAGRRYRARFFCPAMDTSATSARVRLKEGSTVLQTGKPDGDSASAPSFTLDYVNNSSISGSKTWSIHVINTISGTSTLYSVVPTESVGVMSLIVEDIGPV